MSKVLALAAVLALLTGCSAHQKQGTVPQGFFPVPEKCHAEKCAKLYFNPQTGQSICTVKVTTQVTCYEAK